VKVGLDLLGTRMDAKGRKGRGARLHTTPLMPAARETPHALLALNFGQFSLSVDVCKSPGSAIAISDRAKYAPAGVDGDLRLQ
jgi:hypothetical protein